MEEIRRKGAAALLEEIIAWLQGLSQWKHVSLIWQPVPLPQITRGAGGDYVPPCGSPTPGPRYDMIEGQILSPKALTAVLTREAVAKKHVEARERRLSLQGYVFLECYNARELHGQAWGADLVFVFRDHIDPVHENRLHRLLPGPGREWKITQRPKIGI